MRAEVTAIDPATKRVETTAGPFEGDVLVIALGAEYDIARTPGLAEAGHEFYSEAGAFALQRTLAEFGGGDVVIGITAGPFKCPPAPSEAALLLDELLRARGIRDQSSISLVMPFPRPIPPSPDASSALLAAFEERGIAWIPDRAVRSLDADTRTVRLGDGSTLPFDLYLGVPVHRVPEVVQASGLTVDGWVPVDSRTLETSWPGVYAVGDVAAVGTPKAGVFAERQAAAAARRIAAHLRGCGGRRRVRRSWHVLRRVRRQPGRHRRCRRSSTGDRTGPCSVPDRSMRPTRPSSAAPGSAAGSGATGTDSR